MATVDAAYPFIEVKINQPPPPTAQRAPGVLAIVGKATAGATHVPTVISESADIKQFQTGTAESDLTRALALALVQDPRPSTIYAVRVDDTTPDWAAGLASLNGLDDVTFVVLANMPATTVAANTAAISALQTHVESLSSDGNKQMAVAMVDPTTNDSPTKLATDLVGFKSSAGRMILVAARGAAKLEGTVIKTPDVAAAAASAIAGYAPQVSIALKSVSGFSIPREMRYSATDVKALSKAGITPIIDPALLTGEGLYFADARTFDSSGKPFNIFVDGVRVLDDVDFKLKAGLIGSIGDARITKSGMTLVKARTEAILERLVRDAEIDAYTTSIPVLDALNIPESTRMQVDIDLISQARQNRVVDMYVTIWYGPAVHRLIVTLNPKM
jgi:hypothetical protein